MLWRSRSKCLELICTMDYNVYLCTILNPFNFIGSLIKLLRLQWKVLAKTFNWKKITSQLDQMPTRSKLKTLTIGKKFASGKNKKHHKLEFLFNFLHQILFCSFDPNSMKWTVSGMKKKMENASYVILVLIFAMMCNFFC